MFAYDLSGECRLESLDATRAPKDDEGWSPVSAATLAMGDVTVVERRGTTTGGVRRMLRVRDAVGTELWLRNEAAENEESAEARWSCAVDARSLEGLKPLTARTVRLYPEAPTCRGVSLVLGHPSELTFEPYVVLGRRPFRTAGGTRAVVHLATADGSHVVAIDGAELDTCFAATTRAPTPPAERASVLAWLSDPSSSPPELPLASYLHVAGLSEASCLSEGEGVNRHEECRAAPFVVSRVPTSHGIPRWSFARERLVTAVHGYGSRLAAAEEVAGLNVVVRKVRADGGFVSSFGNALVRAQADAAKQGRRAQTGYRLLRASDVQAPLLPSAFVDLEVSYTTSPVEVRRASSAGPSGAGGSRQSGRLDVDAMERRALSAAKEALEASERDAVVLERLFRRAQPACSAGAGTCDVVAVAGLASTHVAKRRQEVAEREEALARASQGKGRLAPTTGERARAAVARRGVGRVTLTLSPTDALPDIPPLSLTHELLFDVEETDASTRATALDAEAAAVAVLAELDGVLEGWSLRAVRVVPAASYRFGSHAHLRLLARHAASNRPVRAMSVMLEDDVAALSDTGTTHALNIPDGGRRCFTFVASALKPGVAVTLALRAKASGALVARDARGVSGAAFDICSAESGLHTLEVRSLDGVAVSVGMFESTPGLVPDADPPAEMPEPRRGSGGRR